MSRGLGKNQQKLLLLLLGGLSLSLSRNPRQYFKTLKAIGKGWNEINRQALKNAIADLYKSKFLEERENKDGSLTIILTENGKRKALTYQIDEIEIKKPEKWDKKWRIILFDIPDKKGKERNALRQHLKKIGFYKYQESVFVHPFDCKDEMDYLIEFYNLRKFVRFVVADQLDNELELKVHFGLPIN